MTRISTVAALLIALSVAGCASRSPAFADLSRADCGPFPSNYEDTVRAHFQTILKDPESARYRFSEPYRAYLRAAPVAGGEPQVYGYIVEVRVNARNSYGGYTGEKFYRVFMRGSRTQIVLPNSWFSERWYR